MLPEIISTARQTNIRNGKVIETADQPRVRAYVQSSPSTPYAHPENTGLWVLRPRDYVTLGPGKILRYALSCETPLLKDAPK